MAELAQVYKTTFAKFLAALLDRGDFLGCRLLFPEDGDPLLHRAGVGNADVVPQRLAHEFRACAMLFPAHAFKLACHCGRQRYRECSGGAAHAHPACGYYHVLQSSSISHRVKGPSRRPPRQRNSWDWSAYALS